MMTLLEQFNTRLKEAMKNKQAQELSLLRMVKTRFQVKLTEKGVEGPLTDEMALAEISAYVKQLKKSLPDFEKAGDRGVEKVEQINFEIDYLKPFLPQMMDEEATRTLVTEKIAELGIASPNQFGKLMGNLMKDYKGKVDPAIVKKVAMSILNK